MKNIALCQMEVIPGQIKLNYLNMASAIMEAKSNKADIIVFPEMCLSGYLIGDKWTEDSFCYNLMEYNNLIGECSKGIVVIYGNVFIDENKIGTDGRKARFNSAYCWEDTKLIGMHFKTLLPTYRIFDDWRYFTSYFDDPKPIVLSDGTKLGIEVCEELWNSDYDFNVTEKYISNGIDVIINISASPYSEGKWKARDNRIAEQKKLLGDKFVPFYYCNCVGAQNNGKNIVCFDGDSRIYNKDGEKLDSPLEPYEDGIIYSNNCTLLAKENCISIIEEKYNAIIKAFQYLDIMLDSKQKIIIGLSGGIDSALSATLAVQALGANRVIGYNLPSDYNSKATKNAAKQLASNLGIEYNVVPINGIYDSVVKNIKENTEWELMSVVHENIQAKIRGTMLLSTFAAINHGVMVNNGNKLETALGYCTMYADTNGVFAPLGDLLKTEIFDMCRFINKKQNIIPKELIPDEDFNFKIIPSAELKEKQVDPMLWGFDDMLLKAMMGYNKASPVNILEWYLNNTICDKLGVSKNLFLKYQLDNSIIFINHLEWFIHLMHRNVFKRIQSPPIVMLSRSSFGFDYRESQILWDEELAYIKLKEQILNER